jgi:ubiquinone biosynthesis O-methyltransferase
VEKKLHSCIVVNPKFRKNVSLSKKDVKERYKIMYSETFQTSVPGTAAIVIDQIKDIIKNKTVLDLGCGAGRLSLFAAKYANHVTGIDYIDTAINYATKFSEMCKIKNVDFQVADIDKFGGKTFDVILISEVFQHVDQPLQTLKKCKKLLNKNGLIIINIPAFNNFRGNVWLTLQNLFNLPMSLTDTYQISFSEMKTMTKKAKLELTQTIGFSYDWALDEWGVEDLKRRIFLATKDGKLDKFANFKSINSWLDSSLEQNKEFLAYLLKQKIIKTRSKNNILKIPKNASKEIRKYLDDGNQNVNRYYCTLEPFNKMGAGAIYIIKTK